MTVNVSDVGNETDQPVVLPSLPPTSTPAHLASDASAIWTAILIMLIGALTFVLTPRRSRSRD